MSHVLHLLTDPANRTAVEVIRAQAASGAIHVSVVLLPAASRLEEPLPGDVYQLGTPHPASPPRPGRRLIDASALLDLVFAADAVVTW